MHIKIHKFFLYINNLLLVIVFFLILFLINQNNFIVFSQQTEKVKTVQKNFKKINNELKVSYEVSDFSVLYVSDGINEAPTLNQKDRFYQKSLYAIPVTINYQFNRDFSKLLLQPDIEFESIPDIYKPINYVCENNDVDGCFNKVTSLSIFSNAVSTKLSEDFDKPKEVKEGDNLILKLSSFVIQTYKNIDKGLGSILVNSGIVDDQRKSVGIISYWGDDDFQNLVPIEYAKGKTPVLSTKTETEKLGVNLSENSFAVDLSNTVKLETDSLVKRPALGLALSFGRIEYIGLNDIYDPFSQFLSDEEFNRYSSIVFRNIADFIFNVTNINIADSSKIGVKKIAHEVPIRSINDTEFNFNLAINVIDAVQEHYPNLPAYPNPYGNSQPEFIIDPNTGRQIFNPLYEKWENYENLNSKIKKTLTFIDNNTENKQEVRDCALKLADNPNAGCDLFSAEESNFRLQLREKTFPLGLNYNSWNFIFNQLNTSLNGPYINPLSVSLCGRLDLAFNIQAKEKYVYRILPKDSKVNYVGKGNKGTIINSYCVVGAGLANFAKSLIGQGAYIGNRVQQKNTLPLDIKGLTCDKKEQYVYNSAIYTYRNIPYSKIDHFSYLSTVAFSEPNSQRKVSLICNSENDCNQHIPLSFSVIKGNDIYGVQGFPVLNYSVLQTYASPENDIQLILDQNGEKMDPKYLFFTASEPDGNKFSRVRLLCNLVPQIEIQQSNPDNYFCLIISMPSWGFANGAALKKVPVKIKKNNSIEYYNLLTLLYQEDDFLKYKYVLINPDDFSKKIILGDKNGYVLSRFEDYHISATQDNFGNLIVSLKNSRGGLKTIKVVSLVAANLDVSLNEKDELVQNSFESKVVYLTQNLCDSSNICKFYNSGDKFLGSLKLFVDYNDVIHVAGLTYGVGFVFRVHSQKTDQIVEPIIFSYVSTHSNRSDLNDEISAFRYEPKYDEYYIFTAGAGYFLHLIPINNIKFEYLPNEACDDYKCYATIQQFFDPSQFLTDFSNYLGEQDSDGNTLEPIGWPIVKDFDLKPNGDIIGVYTYKSLSNFLIFSDDITYSFRGVYTKLAQNSNEASNVYIPSKTDLSPIPFRFFNTKNDGLLIGRDLIEKPDRSFREVIGFNVIGQSSNDNQNSMSLDNLYLVYNGYDRENREEYLRCLYDYAYMQNSIDPFSFLSGVLPVSLNTTLIEDTNTSGDNDNNNNDASSSENGDSGYSSINSGKYCEETWCIPDSFKLVFNDKYTLKPDDNGELTIVPQAHHVDKLIEFLSKRRPNIASLYAQVVPNICLVAAKRGIPCALLIAIWVQESGASVAAESFGCFHPEMLSFELQYVCAANSIVNGYKEFYGIDRKSPIKERVGSGNRPNFRTEPEFTPSKCEAATAFSYIMQRYTPIDQRINVDNQCNRGLIIRSDKVREGICIENKDYFIKYTRIDDNGKEIRVVKIPPNNAWGEAISTRVNLKFVLEQFNKLVPSEDRIPITTNCFVSDTSNTGNNTDTNNQNNEANAGIIKLNVKAWGNSYAAKSLAFAANRLEYGDTVNPSAPFEEGGRDINGVLGQKRKIIIPPKGLFSYNDHIGNGLNLPDFIKNPPDSNILPGIGWCDLATGIRLAAEKVTGPNSLKLKSVYLSKGPLGPDDHLKVAYGMGYGFGGDGDIFHWTHSTPMEASSSFYKKLLTPPKPNYGVDDYNKFVSIFIRLYYDTKYDTKNDGDLIIRNPSDKYNLVLEVDYNSIDRTVTIKFTFENP